MSEAALSVTDLKSTNKDDREAIVRITAQALEIVSSQIGDATSIVINFGNADPDAELPPRVIIFTARPMDFDLRLNENIGRSVKNRLIGQMFTEFQSWLSYIAGKRREAKND